jgi:hypothetical protein
MNAKLDHEFENNSLFQVRLLAQRVEALGREKEQLETDIQLHDHRLRNIERNLSMGWGVLIVMPILGAVLGFLFAYGKIIFKPWL